MEIKKHSYFEIIENNKKWVRETEKIFPNYFKELSKEQNPSFLYIGCADSRLPLSIYTQTLPGEIFVHRNIANQVKINDANFLSVLEYAVEILKVEHIIVAGHYDCSGVKAAYKGNAKGKVKKWISNIRRLYLKNKTELTGLHEKEACDKLAEFNVILQIENLLKTKTLKKAFKKGQYLQLHGWIIDIYTGYIKELKLPIEKWKNKKLIPENVILEKEIK